MSSSVEHRSRRWLLRRLERQERRRFKAPLPARTRPRLLAVASLIDGYCDVLGPAVNDDGAVPLRRPHGPPLAVVRG